MVDIQKGDIVIFKAIPNSGEMIVLDVKEYLRGYSDASDNNPAIKVQFWDAKKQRYEYDTFYYRDVKFVRRE